jgi:AcrR family transcriptional regulator
LSAPKPKPRPRNAAATRAALLAAARSRFADLGYNATSLRDVAAAAGVDAALVSRYFGSKDELFAAALDACDDVSWLDGGVEGLGQRLAAALLEDSACDDDVEGLMMLLRSASPPKARELAGRWSNDSFLGPLSDALGGEDALLRARIAGSMMLGVILTRALFCNNELDAAEQARFRDRLARVLDACVAP